MCWSKDWQSMLRFSDGPTANEFNSITPYALQFANCDRIEKNDAVYIFDEVGSGKTIMAGLMALHYLYNNPGQKVLVITTAALASGKSCKPPLFLKDWYEKLPLRELGMEKRVVVISNNYSTIKDAQAGNYGMVIIDEAQEFLNSQLARYQSLVQDYYWDGGGHKYTPIDDVIKYTLTDKVVFLTATPIKNRLEDLTEYCWLANRMLYKPFPSEDSDKLITYREKFFSQTLGREKLDPEFPATRWFKYTIAALSTSLKECPERLEPQVWTWDEQTSKNDALCEEIRKALNDGVCNRFLVFVRWVARRQDREDAYSIKEDLKQGLGLGDNAIKVIAGSNSDELKSYSGKGKNANLPQILILNYQIAEAGVNLPGYNYVINYHIPSYPSALEQRFGRIDRLNNSRNKEDYYSQIHVCYLIRIASSRGNGSETSLAYIDSNACNFREAVLTYLHGMLPHLPSRNALISRDVLTQYQILDQAVEDELGLLKKWKKDKAAFQAYQDRTGHPAKEVPFRYKNLIAFFEQQDPESTQEDEGSNSGDDSSSYYDDVITREITRREKYLKSRVPLKEFGEIPGFFNGPESQDVIFYKDGSGQLQYKKLLECTDSIRDCAKDYTLSFEREINNILKQQMAGIHNEHSTKDTKDWKPVCQGIGFSSWEAAWSQAFDLIWERADTCEENISAYRDKFGYQGKLEIIFTRIAGQIGKENYISVCKDFPQEYAQFPQNVQYCAAWAFHEALKVLQNQLPAGKPEFEILENVSKPARLWHEAYVRQAVCHPERYPFDFMVPICEFGYERALSIAWKGSEERANVEIQALAWKVFKESYDAVRRRISNMDFVSKQALRRILRSEMKRALRYIGLDMAFLHQCGSPEEYEKMADGFLSPITDVLFNAANA